MDWALQQASRCKPVVSEFHSSLEQSVLKLLLQARCPMVVVLARLVEGARFPSERTDPLAQGCIAVVSAAKSATRLTKEVAAVRNRWVAAPANYIVVAYASLGARLAGLCDEWRTDNRPIHRLV